MVAFKYLTQISLAASVLAGNAPIVADSPTDAKYIAKFDKSVQGSVEFSAPNGTVFVAVNLKDFPGEGPWTYHVHAHVVPTDGNCTGTLGHLNPYNGAANGTTAAAKEVGDLAGKHGSIEGTSINTTYYDPYLSLDPSDPAFLGNLSVTLHLKKDNSRIACANITRVEDSTSSTGSSSSNSSASGSSSSNSTSSSTSTASGAASNLGLSSGLAIIAAAAYLLN